jgi:hypothetical protein
LIAQQLDKLPESASKASIATRLLGADWRNQVALFKQGSEALLSGGESVRNLSESEIKSGKALSDGLSDLGKAFDAIKNRIGTLFAPGATTRAAWLTDLIDGANKLLQGFINADDAKKKLVAGDAGGFLDSFKEFLSQSGETGLAKAIGFIRDLSKDLAQVWTNVLIPAGNVIIAAFNGIAEKINAAFGTDISGRFVAIVAAIGLAAGAFGALRAVIAPIIALFGLVVTSIGALGPLLLSGRACDPRVLDRVPRRRHGCDRRGAGRKRGLLCGVLAIGARQSVRRLGSVQERGACGIRGRQDRLAKIFGGEGSAVFTNISRLLSGIALAASGVAAIFNAIFGTNINARRGCCWSPSCCS